ncbi:hypothetical protein CTA2_10073 [Colletotrichum tanaceti]|uniref:Zn(2)-C6 fungal-type domain-containing protein n=1 Tax=Colletotrichum tanaceti TaxID=1306861 RepID=A0A4U6X828_9PEZI|nr:hypothetical protein CTA2_10073 [Colletotrichum tanaceti]TKW51089.1 hypothetical protein CTA1_6150 [Colletotrichum tanaceti]
MWIYTYPPAQRSEGGGGLYPRFSFPSLLFPPTFTFAESSSHLHPHLRLHLQSPPTLLRLGISLGNSPTASPCQPYPIVTPEPGKTACLSVCLSVCLSAVSMPTHLHSLTASTPPRLQYQMPSSGSISRTGACQRCHRLKVRCDRTRPSSAPYARVSGVQCPYAAREHQIQLRRQDVERLEQHIRDLRAKNDGLVGRLADVQYEQRRPQKTQQPQQ